MSSYSPSRTAFDPESKTFKILNIDGSVDTTLQGDEAMRAGAPMLYHFSPNRKTQDSIIAGRPDDYRRNSWRYKIYRKLQDIAEDPVPTLPGRILNKGPLAGGSAGALAGYGTGALADWILDKINGGERDPMIQLKWLGALAGGGTGAVLGHYRKKYDSGNAADNWSDNARRMSKYAGMVKTSAMFNDPRNLILERLQGANDLGFAEKANLANAVRNLDPASAKQLADMVRASLGFGVGAIIARYILGMKSSRGTLFGGIVGLLGSSLYKRMMN